MRNEPWVWPEVGNAGTSGAGAVPLRSAQMMGKQKKKKKKEEEKSKKGLGFLWTLSTMFTYCHFDSTLPSYISASLCSYQTSRTLRSVGEKL